MRRIDLNEDPTTVSADLRLEYAGQPFTGEVVEELVPGQLLSQEFYLDGLRHGSCREWWPDGRLKSEGESCRGQPRGVFRRWHPNGRLAAESLFGEHGELEAIREWDEHGRRR
ncbi:toxin-antitoxin system YwqK family antitoxin [Nocardia fusca]|jgi:antitoxin component YwqK of YwqJK toxin-antitoxin module|uniref:toxin-antitoxin system YwqK family antitoxin n=1 Tax=Nocardia fusca TaxID=941183 RepID=UPI0037C919B1